MKQVQIVYDLDNTVCMDVDYTDGRVNSKIKEDGSGYVRMNNQSSAYGKIYRIRVTEVRQAGERRDMYGLAE